MAGEASSRVLILIDGQEVTYQRAGDNYGVGLLIDESALERVEVVKGPYPLSVNKQHRYPPGSQGDRPDDPRQLQNGK